MLKNVNGRKIPFYRNTIKGRRYCTCKQRITKTNVILFVTLENVVIEIEERQALWSDWVIDVRVWMRQVQERTRDGRAKNKR